MYDKHIFYYIADAHFSIDFFLRFGVLVLALHNCANALEKYGIVTINTLEENKCLELNLSIYKIIQNV